MGNKLRLSFLSNKKSKSPKLSMVKAEKMHTPKLHVIAVNRQLILFKRKPLRNNPKSVVGIIARTDRREYFDNVILTGRYL